MHLQAASSVFGDTLGGRNRVNLETHSKAVIERHWRCTWRPSSSVFRDTHGGGHRVSLKM